MASIVLQHLDRFGPTHCETLSVDAARDYCHDLATTHYENFTVISRLLPERLRPHFGAVYAFCRWADDLGDETGDPQRSQQLLDWWRDELDRCYEARPRHPVFVALRPTVEQFEIPRKPFDDLIDAFLQDQQVTRYEDWDQVVDYCTRSADPVGRLVLYMCGYRDAHRQQLSDATCTALQLANFWQDVRRDIVERDRIYVPADDLATHGLTHQDLIDHVRGKQTFGTQQRVAYRCVLRGLVMRTWPLFERGRQLLPLLARDVRLPVRLFSLGGEAVLKRISAIDHDTLDHRPQLSRPAKMALMSKGLIAHLFDARRAVEVDADAAEVKVGGQPAGGSPS